MGAQSPPRPISVEQFERIPDPSGGRYELRHGELVFVTRPVRRHWDLQQRLQKLLESTLQPAGYIVGTEYAYRPLPEHELWGADVACVSEARHLLVGKWLLGSPELAIEVKSPSNTKAELQDKAMTTLAGEGAVEFWIVDPDARAITVHRKTGIALYVSGESVPLPVVDGSVDVDAVFSGF